MRHTVMARAWIFSLVLAGSAHVHAQRVQIFSIGTKNDSFSEFSQNREPGHPVLYQVGQSSAERDWPAYQPGSFDSVVGRSTMQQDWVEAKPDASPEPFQVRFNLLSSPRGTFILHLDAIFRYRHPAPPLYTLAINGKSAASYRLNPHAAPELWWPNGGEGAGNLQYFGYESVEMQLPASAFVAGANTLSLQCLDGFGIYYDDLSLSNDPLSQPSLVTEAFVEPTALYKSRPSGLVELQLGPLRFRVISHKA
jgi:hypothetical protein